MKNRILKTIEAAGGRIIATIGAVLLFSSAGVAANMLEFELERSFDLQNWETIPLTGNMLTADGKIRVQAAEESAFFRLRIDTVDGEPVPEDMVFVEGGTLPPESEIGEVAVDSFYIARNQLTWGEWKEVRAWAIENGYDLGGIGDGCADDHPVHSVSWYDVVKWSNARSEMEGLTPVYTVGGGVYRSGQSSPNLETSAGGYRLPLEAEWEFAARGGNQSQGFTYSGSDDLDDVGWYWENSEGAACEFLDGRGTWPVGQKQANELGIYDMSGNVWEWCWDTFNGDRHIRGGSWFDDAIDATVSIRIVDNPVNRFDTDGVRLARTPSS